MISKLCLTNIFADEIFSGEKIAVVILNQLAREDWLQKLAREVETGLTCYVLPRESDFMIRFFSPDAEISRADKALMPRPPLSANLAYALPKKRCMF